MTVAVAVNGLRVEVAAEHVADVRRFLSYVDPLPCGCWFFTGARSRGKGNRKWYGSFWRKGGTVRAHRFAAEVIGGAAPLEPDEHRDHTCVFSMCVNPAHIETVTKVVNQGRKVARRRSAIDQPQTGVSS